MNQKPRTDDSGPSTKIIKANDEAKDSFKCDAVSVNDEQQLSDIFKLTIDCFEDVFDFLPLNCKDDLFSALIAACSNVKHLSIEEHCRLELSWLYQICPKLEHLELMYVEHRKETPELKIFLEQNTTIKQLSIDMKLFWINRELFKNMNIKLDTLAVRSHKRVEVASFCRLLNELHECGFYKTLHFYYRDGEKLRDGLATVGSLVKIDCAMFENFTLGACINLEELCVSNSFLSPIWNYFHIPF